MNTRIAIISIILDNPKSVMPLNQLLHDSREYIIGRMGIPYKKNDINLISVAIDAPEDVINALTGKIGKLEGVTAKTVYSKI